MKYLRRIGIDTYMLLLIGMVLLGVVLPVRGIAAEGLSFVTFWAVALLFFLYGAKLNPAAIRDGLLHWRLQGLTFGATYLLFPILGLIFATIFGSILGPEVTTGLLFLAILPSTVQSSIAFTSIAHGNVPAAICAASLSNMIGVALTPALVALLLSRDGGGVSMDAILRIGTQIVLPFAVGQVLRPWIGAFVTKHKTMTMIVDRGAILLIVYSAFSAGTVSGLWHAVPALRLVTLIAVVMLFLALAMGVMAFAGRIFGLVQADRAVLFFCGSTKSLASGLPIAMALFPAAAVGATILPTMIYHMTQLLVCAFIAQRMARAA